MLVRKSKHWGSPRCSLSVASAYRAVGAGDGGVALGLGEDGGAFAARSLKSAGSGRGYPTKPPTMVSARIFRVVAVETVAV